MSSRKGFVMRVWNNFTSFTSGKSAKMSKTDKWDTLRSFFVHFFESVLLEWYPRLFPEERHLSLSLAKSPFILEPYLIYLVKP